LPAVLAVQETLDVPDPATLLGVIAPQVKPLGTVSLRVTVPEKWFTPVMVIVEEADRFTLTPVGDVAVVVKSWTITLTVTACDRLPLEPATVTV